MKTVAIQNKERIKLTEDETIAGLIEYLKQQEWDIISCCSSRERGNDIVASKLGKKLVVEVKGAKASATAPTKKRNYFDSGQIKTHFGKAIVKILEEKRKEPQAKFAIAHPNDEEIKKAIGNLIPFLKDIGITHYWVSKDGTVLEV